MSKQIIQRKENVCKTLMEVFGVLARCPSLAYTTDDAVIIKTADGRSLLHITSTTLTTPVNEITDNVVRDKSPLPDAFISMTDFGRLIDCINEKDSVQSLDHIGFCYMTKSQEKELADIKQAHKDLSLYKMTSNDLAKWYFVGDRSNWKDPMVELLPTLPNTASDLPYWMPHVHIDIETMLSSEDIEIMIKDIFGNTRHPIQFRDPTYGVYNVRLRLGVISGVNIMLDIGTKVTNLQWIRANMLQEIM